MLYEVVSKDLVEFQSSWRRDSCHHVTQYVSYSVSTEEPRDVQQ